MCWRNFWSSLISWPQPLAWPQNTGYLVELAPSKWYRIFKTWKTWILRCSGSSGKRFRAWRWTPWREYQSFWMTRTWPGWSTNNVLKCRLIFWAFATSNRAQKIKLFLTEKFLMSQLRKQLNFHDSFRVEAVIEGPADTPYFGGKFRVKLTIGKDFPAAPPKG